ILKLELKVSGGNGRRNYTRPGSFKCWGSVVLEDPWLLLVVLHTEDVDKRVLFFFLV
ncbi:hypothetical protein LINGRAHAP2_LOCUS31693, partial [Linum grandiflorum]